MAEAFKRKLHERGLKRIVRANKASCLDQCAAGRDAWSSTPRASGTARVTVDDVDEIIEQHILGGSPSALVPPERLTGRMPRPGR